MNLLAGVIGDPIGHSRSPRLHGYWLRFYGIEAQYVPLQVRHSDLAESLRLLPRMGFRGLNVTVPHKVAVMDFASAVTPLARRIGAANTLTFTEAGIEADNTDAYGFTWNIRQARPDWKPERVVVIGAGGASQAVIVALQDAGAKEIRITNRSLDRAEELAAEFDLQVVPWASRSAALADADSVINTTSLGMSGQPPLELALDDLPQSALVTDIVYTPLETDLLARARARGNVVVDGLGMLLHQAAPGFERWFGTRPEVTEALRREVLG